MVTKSTKRKSTKLRGDALTKAIEEAKKDPQWMKELREFIKITTS
jgi:hypothetical protein